MSSDFEFCITFIDPSAGMATLMGGITRQHVRLPNGHLRLFSSQSKAYKWLSKNSLAHLHFSVDPWHDLEGVSSP